MNLSAGEGISILITLAVGIYFAIYYPRGVRKRFSAHTMPRAFIVMVKIVPVVGYLILGLTLIYSVAILAGLAPKS